MLNAAVALALLQVAPVAPAPPAATVPQAPHGVTLKPAADASVAMGDPNRIICRRLPSPTGSRLGKRQVCKSQHDWSEEARMAREALDGAQTRHGYKGG